MVIGLWNSLPGNDEHFISLGCFKSFLSQVGLSKCLSILMLVSSVFLCLYTPVLLVSWILTINVDLIWFDCVDGTGNCSYWKLQSGVMLRRWAYFYVVYFVTRVSFIPGIFISVPFRWTYVGRIEWWLEAVRRSDWYRPHVCLPVSLSLSLLVFLSGCVGQCLGAKRRQHLR